jgi:hypothetical protein
MSIIKEIGRNPNIDWIAILLISVLLLISFAFAGLSLYNTVTNGNIQGNGVSTNTPLQLNEKAITSVISNFSQKEKVSDRVRAGYSSATDPSI